MQVGPGCERRRGLGGRGDAERGTGLRHALPGIQFASGQGGQGGATGGEAAGDEEAAAAGSRGGRRPVRPGVRRRWRRGHRARRPRRDDRRCGAQGCSRTSVGPGDRPGGGIPGARIAGACWSRCPRARRRGRRRGRGGVADAMGRSSGHGTGAGRGRQDVEPRVPVRRSGRSLGLSRPWDAGTAPWPRAPRG